MAFFRPHVFSPYTATQQQQQQQAEPSFHGLFRLLEDWDNHHNTQYQQQPAKRSCQRAAARCQQPVFTPRFDIQETESAYELYGELPGVQKQDINIEFSDPQTLVIRGRVERSSSSTSSTSQDGQSNLLASSSSSTSAGSEGGEHNDEEEGVLLSHDEETTVTPTAANANANANADAHSDTASQRSLKATVEDDTEDQDASVLSASAATIEKDTNTAHEQSSANHNGTTASTTGPGSNDAEGRAKSQTTQPASKFWISERSVGTFSRTFEFPERIEIDNVSAGLENGVLSLRVPKAKKFGVRQISVL